MTEEKAVRSILSPYAGTIYRAVLEGWEDWCKLKLNGQLLYVARSRACLVYDFIVQRNIMALADHPSVRVVHRDETAKFIFDGQLALRFKKAGDNGLGSNIGTQATLGFVDQQRELPGIPAALKVEVVYALNALQTKIDDVSVVARDGDRRLWGYPLAPETTATIIPLPTPADAVSPGKANKARVKVRTSDEGESTETGKQ